MFRTSGAASPSVNDFCRKRRRLVRLALFLLCLNILKTVLMKKSFFAVAALLAVMLGGCSGDMRKKDRVENVILMIGDGMGLTQVTALMVDKDYSPTAFDRAQGVGLVKTYSANNRVTDSAAAGTALSTGEKTDNAMLGMLPDSSWCYSIMARAAARGMATGIVVTYDIVHATPAAFYAHVPERHMYDSIAVQLAADSIDVLFGSGRKYFTGRGDGRDLLADMRRKGYEVYDDWREAVKSEGKRVAFIGEGYFPTVTNGRDTDYLAEATRAAMRMLKKASPEGFMLMVEGSQIDFGGHDNDREMLLAEMHDFERAVTAAFDFADYHPGTLVVVTADHETGGLTMPSGNPDYTAAESGIEHEFSTGGHTGTLVPVYAYGTGASRFSSVMENTDIPKIIADLLGFGREPDSGR